MPAKTKVGTLAIDPGLRGAIALLIDGRFADVADMPLGRKKSGRNQVDPRELHVLLLRFREQVTTLNCLIETVAAMPARGRAQGTSGMLSLGDSFGVVRAVASIVSDRVNYVMPAVWKKRMGLNKDKEYSRTRARDLFPTACSHLERKKDEGRAEALLLAAYAHEGYSWGESSSR